MTSDGSTLFKNIFSPVFLGRFIFTLVSVVFVSWGIAFTVTDWVLEKHQGFIIDRFGSFDNDINSLNDNMIKLNDTLGLQNNEYIKIVENLTKNGDLVLKQQAILEKKYNFINEKHDENNISIFKVIHLLGSDFINTSENEAQKLQMNQLLNDLKIGMTPGGIGAVPFESFKIPETLPSEESKTPPSAD